MPLMLRPQVKMGDPFAAYALAHDLLLDGSRWIPDKDAGLECLRLAAAIGYRWAAADYACRLFDGHHGETKANVEALTLLEALLLDDDGDCEEYTVRLRLSYGIVAFRIATDQHPSTTLLAKAVDSGFLRVHVDTYRDHRGIAVLALGAIYFLAQAGHGDLNRLLDAVLALSSRLDLHDDTILPPPVSVDLGHMKHHLLTLCCR